VDRVLFPATAITGGRRRLSSRGWLMLAGMGCVGIHSGAGTRPSHEVSTSTVAVVDAGPYRWVRHYFLYGGLLTVCWRARVLCNWRRSRALNREWVEGMRTGSRYEREQCVEKKDSVRRYSDYMRTDQATNPFVAMKRSR